MYMDYGKLWSLLAGKGMSKTDLGELTGISSRVMAKLSKNETVTTETLARICEVLDCDVCDIMECVSEQKLSVYAAYKRFGVCTEEQEQYSVIRFTHGGRQYVVYRSKAVATNRTVQIACGKNGTVYWKSFYKIGHIHLPPTVTVLVKPPRNREEIEIVLVRGKPHVIEGLDENGFVSSRGRRQKDTDVFVMSEAAFKLFEGEAVEN